MISLTSDKCCFSGRRSSADVRLSSSRICIDGLHRNRRSARRAPAVEPRTSLIPQTLEDMESDPELLAHLANVAQVGQATLTREEKLKRQRSLDNVGAPSFYAMVKERDAAPLVRGPATILQLNIGLYCNQACTHCHVESSPNRSEAMDQATMDRCLQLARDSGGMVTTLDITGGAPEYNPHFRYLVQQARALGLEVIDRCNLTVLMEPGMEDLAQFLADQRVRVVASLPCYSAKNVDQQRGAGVFERSIEALQLLNSLGYGQEGTGLVLDLVYNPNGTFLAPSQAKLQPAYKQELQSTYGIVFNNLFALNNMPIKRFADFLVRRGKLDEYMKLLVDNFNAAAADSIMCRNTLSVGWDGRVYDCDFNQQLEMTMTGSSSSSQSNGGSASSSSEGGRRSSRELTVFDVPSLHDLSGKPIKCDNHCYGCTAGAGSSCQGALS